MSFVVNIFLYLELRIHRSIIFQRLANPWTRSRRHRWLTPAGTVFWEIFCSSTAWNCRLSRNCCHLQLFLRSCTWKAVCNTPRIGYNYHCGFYRQAIAMWEFWQVLESFRIFLMLHFIIIHHFWCKIKYIDWIFPLLKVRRNAWEFSMQSISLSHHE